MIQRQSLGAEVNKSFLMEIQFFLTYVFCVFKGTCVNILCVYGNHSTSS